MKPHNIAIWLDWLILYLMIHPVNRANIVRHYRKFRETIPIYHAIKQPVKIQMIRTTYYTGLLVIATLVLARIHPATLLLLPIGVITLVAFEPKET